MSPVSKQGTLGVASLTLAPRTSLGAFTNSLKTSLETSSATSSATSSTTSSGTLEASLRILETLKTGLLKTLEIGLLNPF